MVAFYKPKKKVENTKAFEVMCQNLDLHCRGVCKKDDKIYFVEGLLPNEKARILVTTSKGKTADASITKLIEASDKRRIADCEYLDKCGGCPLQYVPLDMALEAKISGVSKLLKRQCNLDLPKISYVGTSNEKGYRRAARFALRLDHGKINLGFRGNKSHDLVSIDKCLVVSDRINNALPLVKAVINKLECKRRLGHIEFLDSDGYLGILVRVNAILNDKDKDLLTLFAKDNNFTLAIAETCEHEITQKEYIKETILANADDLYINSDACRINCTPSSFVQINKEINTNLVSKVIEACSLNESSKVLDMFCGLGNFTLPIAKRAQMVVGVDIVKEMINKALANATLNNLNNANFINTDLEDKFENQIFAKQKYDVIVMDPGRSGAKRATLFVCKIKPKKVVLISCNPLAASRDIVELLKAGYKIDKWALFDMFPRTTHAETMFVFSL